nr:immunoglobulin light chain junction region [Macaca mulatta]MOW09101.1 immunoglobulin light chain junction region [Macaca mulatta]MOW10548.1 immunoglobulin light chain junction region [Macaca mulatta]MOW12008.1 immunoglobulin light chain junction region [Macaca mulatta]
CQHGDGMPFTF